MKNQIKTALGSAFAVATLILITTGGAIAQEKGCINCMCNRPQQPNNLPQQPSNLPRQSNNLPQQPNSVPQQNSVPAQFSQPGYIRGK